jgi:hypothetical protein
MPINKTWTWKQLDTPAGGDLDYRVLPTENGQSLLMFYVGCSICKSSHIWDNAWYCKKCPGHYVCDKCSKRRDHKHTYINYLTGK